MPHPALSRTDHRPWPLPGGPWVMSMEWHDLLFAHWPVEPAAMRTAVSASFGARPEPAVELDLFDGCAWLGIVPFRMAGVRLRGTPALPGPGAFPELNVRTYVTVGGKPGVLFFSLDAASRIAVRAARTWFHLPYFDAAMRCESDGDAVVYASRRTHRGASPAAFEARYEAPGPVFAAAPGTLEHWLTERYCLYAVARDGRVFRGDVHHAPWPLQRARLNATTNTMATAAGLVLPDTAAHLLFARRLDVAAWSPVRVR